MYLMRQSLLTLRTWTAWQASRMAMVTPGFSYVGCNLPSRRLHLEHSEAPTKTIGDVIDGLLTKLGYTSRYTGALDRTYLRNLIPKSQDELPPRRMMDSWDSAIIPLGSDPQLREKYITFVGGVRAGRLLEDLDVFAVWLCYKHILNPLQAEGQPSPYSIVTALVDKIDFRKGVQLVPDRDVKISGHVSWVGRSSIETILDVEQMVEGRWQQVTRAVFVMVARDPLNQGSAVVNPIECVTEEEKDIFQQGEASKLHRKLLQKECLFISPPSETEKTLVHDLFMKMADAEQLSFAPKSKPDYSVWMKETKLKNLIICHPESRNIFNKIFGGFLMRQALELAWVTATMFSKQRPSILHIDDIMFRQPVEIGSLLYLNSQVVYTEGHHVQVSTKASVVDAATSSSNLTNIFHFTFDTKLEVPTCLPRTYDEAMLYLDGRRHYQIATGARKFYAQGESPGDSPK